MRRLIIVAALLAFPGLGQAAQTCFSHIPATTPTGRFTDNGDGTVTDTATLLQWKRCVEGMSWNGTACNGTAGTFTWQQALQAPAAINVGAGFAGHNDWRVPNIKELETIIESQCIDPQINETVFPNTVSFWSFWSSTPYGNHNSSLAWVSRNQSDPINLFNRSDTIQLRLVRGN